MGRYRMMSMQAASRSFVRMGFKPLNLNQQLFSARTFCAAPPIAEKIQALVDKEKVVVFMKGVPDAPQCGFSNAVCQIMRMHDVTFTGHNVLADEELRQGIKDFSNWPTIPQVYLEGEFIGGCDIMLQMHQSGELIEELVRLESSQPLPRKQKRSDLLRDVKINPKYSTTSCMSECF